MVFASFCVAMVFMQMSSSYGVHVTALCPGFTYTEFHDVNGMRDRVSKLPKWIWLDADAVAPAPLPPAALAAVAASQEEATRRPEPATVVVARASQAGLSEAMAQPVVTKRAMVNPPAEPVRRLAALPPTLPTGVELASMVGQAVLSGGQGPRRFRWIVPGVLAGCPQPGVVAPIEYDLDLLGAVGVTHLITLTERDLPQDLLRIHGLANTHLPIFDREAPSTGQMQMLLVRMQRLLQAGEVLAVHCLAGAAGTGPAAGV